MIYLTLNSMFYQLLKG